MSARPRDVVVAGASAGGVEALRAMVAGLAPDLRASVLVVLHMPAGGTTALPAILNRVGTLPATMARNGEPLEHGHIYVARPDHHLLVMGDAVALSHGPTENGYRPAINALFRSAALARGAAVTGVLLSGVLDDGVAGLHAIAGCGGRVVVQDPADALYPGMPGHALRSLMPDHVAPAPEIGEVLAKITSESVEENNGLAPDMLRWENDMASAGWVPQASHTAGTNPDPDARTNHTASTNPDPSARTNHTVGTPFENTRDVEGSYTVGMPSEFSCPDCSGVLSDIDDGKRFRCRVGHAWTAEALLAAQGSALERALWTALRSLEEKTALSLRMAGRARERGNHATAARYEQQAKETTEATAVLRQQIAGSG